ncbi:acetoacetate--CoA ligase [Paraburkholderia pallida]|uniref:Acetoacetate--CoA ligase n=1 Tax=Paraburkholderia pallida TaxID=2547399 RepID=A0A4P7D1W0_9BURK|nr:acetoacetate--CoA ligase [Paraburkholderia pallida]QBR00760.1 acetoacetate--CoA ligase [Paraburkholderia pallida]
MRNLDFDINAGHRSIDLEPIYRPSPERVAASQMTAFAAALQTHSGVPLPDYPTLHALSVTQYRTFWRFFIDWCEGLDLAGNPEPVCIGNECESATFFPNLELNYADNLLREIPASVNAYALTACHADGREVRMTRTELRARVAQVALALERQGLRAGDRVAAVLRNDENAVIAALAVAALGATLSTAAPDMGVDALLDRFGQLSPTLLIAHTAPLPFDRGTPVPAKVAELASSLDSLKAIVSLDDGQLSSDVKQPLLSLRELVASADAADFVWRRFPFNHQLFIMFSSGTTGKPKCIVHGAGGTLIEHLKEHRLHSDFRDGDKLYFHTSCSWMMWNWQLSALASGVEIVTYDGPIANVDTLWRLVADQKVTVFGTSPAYLKMCSEAKLVPGQQFDLRALRALMSTGATLFDAQYEWVRQNVKPLSVQSISGGTDILGCFVLGNPNLPVYSGEAQCTSLALDVCAWHDSAPTDLVGELVCRNPFPSRPLGFFNDPDGSRFHAAYFAANHGVWTHGDRIEFSSQGGARLHGRSDGVLNVRGIKVGPGDIYRIISDIPGIHEAMVVEQRMPVVNGSHDASSAADCGPSARAAEQRVVLLLVLERELTLTGSLKARIRQDLARRGSLAHVPDVIVQVDELPVTHSGKLSEAAVRSALNDLPVGNTAALRNPACLESIRHHPALSSKRAHEPAGESTEDLERYLQVLWERLFDLSPIDPDANFFELGGDSLLGAGLVAEIEAGTGRTISLATLLAAPTIRRLADWLRNDTATDASQAIVQIRPGTGHPVFVVHSITGTVMESSRLIGRLQCARPFYGLHAQGLGGELPPQSSVEEMAASYIAQIRSIQAEGPYSIIGYSFGGMVAFEVAQQLSRAGEAIELLCLLDTYVNERYLPLQHWLQFHCQYVVRQWHALRSMSRIEGMRHISRKLSAVMDRIRMRFGHLARRPAADTVGLPPLLVRVRESMRVAMMNYQPRAYSAGPIHFLRADSLQHGRADPLPVWMRVASKGVVVSEVSGSHSGILQEPNVRAVAWVLDRALSGTVQLQTLQTQCAEPVCATYQPVDG